MGELGSAALALVDLHYRVFPCWPGLKVPATGQGFHDATADPEQVAAWWTRNPQYNLAVPTAGLLVIDIDGAGNPWPEDQEQRASLADAGAIATTPRGGRHYVFRQPDGKGWRISEGALAPKVDVRADGGYILVAPSRTGDGEYSWLDGCELDRPARDLPLPPRWLEHELDRLASREQKAAKHVADGNTIPEGQRNATLFRLGCSIRQYGLTADEIAAALHAANQSRCHPPLPRREVDRIVESVGKYEPDYVRTADVEGLYAQLQTADVEEEDDLPPALLPEQVPEELLDVPGLVNDVQQYCLDTAPYPDRVLAFCGALSLLSLLTGRKVRDSGGVRTNLYLLGLANSGVGKDWPRQLNQRLLTECGQAKMFGDSFASGEGLEDRMHIQPAALFQVDELDTLFRRINDAKDGRQESLMAALLKFYGASSSAYPMRVKAGQEDALLIHQPHLVVFGTAIPKYYYESISERMLSNGLFARFLVLEAGKRSDGAESVYEDLPRHLLESVGRWLAYNPGGNLQTESPRPREVRLSDDAADVYRQHRCECSELYRTAESESDEGGMSVWARAGEKARKLGLLAACSENALCNAVEARHAVWGCTLASWVTRNTLRRGEACMSSSDLEKQCSALLATLAKWHADRGDALMPFWRIARRHRWARRVHDDVRTLLTEQRRLFVKQVRHEGAGRPGLAYSLFPG